MTTSCSSSSAALALALAAVLSCAACSSDPPADCANEETPTFGQLDDTMVRRAVARFERTVAFDVNGKSSETGVIALSLVDVRKTKSDQRVPERLVGSQTCVLLTGAPRLNQCRNAADTPPCPPERLSIDDVAIGGVAGGAATLAKQAEGTYVAESPPSPLFGGDELTVAVSGKSDVTHFPTYMQSIAAPGKLELTSPAPGKAVLGGDIAVKWSGGSAGNYMEIRVGTNRPGDTDAVVCVVVDDGCHTLPAVVFDRLSLGMDPGDSFELRLRRINVAIKQIDTETAASISSVQTVISLHPQQ